MGDRVQRPGQPPQVPVKGVSCVQAVRLNWVTLICMHLFPSSTSRYAKDTMNVLARACFKRMHLCMCLWEFVWFLIICVYLMSCIIFVYVFMCICLRVVFLQMYSKGFVQFRMWGFAWKRFHEVFCARFECASTPTLQIQLTFASSYAFLKSQMTLINRKD